MTPIRLGFLPDSVLAGVLGVRSSGWTLPGVAGGATRSTGVVGLGRRRCAGLVGMAEPYGPHRTPGDRPARKRAAVWSAGRVHGPRGESHLTRQLLN